MSIIYCQICNNIFSKKNALGSHISKVHHLSTQQYYDRYLRKEGEGFCGHCYQPTKFRNSSIGYIRYCQGRCASLGGWKELRCDPIRVQRAANNYSKASRKRWSDPQYHKRISKQMSISICEINSKLTDKQIASKYRISGMKGYFKPKNISKYKGDPRDIVYRSSYEFKAMMMFDNDPDVIMWSSENVIVPYISPSDGRYHRYFVDFQVHKKDGTKYLYEVKPEYQCKPPKAIDSKKKLKRTQIYAIVEWAKNQAKWSSAHSWCQKNDHTFQLLTERHLGIPLINK